MNIVMDAYSETKLNDIKGDRPGYFKLFYDTENCGCNGVLAIQLQDKPLETDIQIPVQSFIFLVDRQQECLFDETMKLEADRSYPVFKVASDSALYSTHVKISDIRR